MAILQPNNHSLLDKEDGTIRKVIEPDTHFTVNEAWKWAERMTEYRQRLNALGVPVSRDYYVEVEKGRVTEHCANSGDDLQKLLVEKAITSNEAVRSILQAIRGILAQEKPEVGIDPHPANWCIDSSRVLTFVDFFPVYFTEAGEPLVGFPQPSQRDEQVMNFRRYYTPLGIVRLIRFNFVRICGLEAEAIISEAIEAVVDASLSIPTALKELDVEQVRKDRSKLVEIVPKLMLENVDDLREVAMIMTSNTSSSLLDQILKLTTVDFRLARSLREARFEEAKKLILQSLLI